MAVPIRILIVDDDPQILKSLSRALAVFGHDCTLAGSAAEARGALERGRFELVVCDITLGADSGLDLTEEITARYPNTAVMMVSGDENPATAEEAFERGALDYLVKPYTPNVARIAIQSVLRRRAELQLPRRTPDDHPDLATRQLMALARSVARTPSTVLVTGESGVGKEVISRYIHDQSDRASEPFIGINCAALPESLIEAELFGYEKGAFTGANQRHAGVFERAQGGTLLLDEITEIPLAMQAKLLRVLQERQVTRVGGTKPIQLDVRVIATSNRDLKQCVQEGTFRLDLYYRVNVFPLSVPPLRERPKAIVPLARELLGRARKRLGAGPADIDEAALAALSRYRFPGNVRELANIMERAAILAYDSDTVAVRHIVLDEAEAVPAPLFVDVEEALDPVEVVPFVTGDHAVVIEAGACSLGEVEQRVILETLSRFEGNRTRTAEALGVSLRTVRNKIREYRESGVAVP